MANLKLIAAIVLALTACAWAGDKHPERKQRDNFARQFAAEVEHDGYEIQTWAMRPGCPYVCINHGNHDALRVFIQASVQGLDSFIKQELVPRKQQMIDLGFVEIDFLGMEPSNSYPDGTARFPLK
jgi:hypothetical protein